jgi:hypothetical protein
MTMAKRKQQKKISQTAHTIPPKIPLKVVTANVVNRSKHEEEDIRAYLEWQLKGEEVLHLEKVMTEHIFTNTFDCWDVHTNSGRYWVITHPTNYYSQELFPSLDYTLSFHIGVTQRVMAQDQKKATSPNEKRLLKVWRRLIQALEALDEANEPEGFQAVGMRCRECLLELVRAVAKHSMIPPGQDAPKSADFIHWTEIIADTIAKGSSASEVRGYLKALSKSTWQLVNWLTHASNAVQLDARIAVNATQETFGAFSAALIKFESGSPDRCPNCGSYRLAYFPHLKNRIPEW